ncbi:hypothetical protein [Veillonella sp. R32]|uniref:hypothetical protein n=1 Tax=Veillonella sp. R32 TaxID=2021312 RepID=UPI00138A1B7C|nr:hypothetical protein [Veillonella sp. R32]KAF1682650.1 hypothetical protein VER_04765 [Veillonella sp. R32]
MRNLFLVGRIGNEILKFFLISLAYYITWDALRGFITESNRVFLLILNGLICSYWIYYWRVRYSNKYLFPIFSIKQFMSLYIASMPLYLFVFDVIIRDKYVELVFYPYFHAYTIINALLFPLLHFIMRFFIPFIALLLLERVLTWRRC